jgi:hypothetical protein
MQRPVTPPPPVDDGDGDDDAPLYADTPWDFPARSLVAAADVPPPKTAAVSSIWGMAALAASVKGMKAQGRFGAAAGFVASAPSPAVVREGPIVRVTGARYPADRWTEEREEQEKARRARQKPPRPTKKARTRGKKVRQWDGEGYE